MENQNKLLLNKIKHLNGEIEILESYIRELEIKLKLKDGKKEIK